MLKLKRVEIQGFKSFYDRTEMKFSGSGIAAIVGPNGCGKSNLSDAVSWVLGEQSARTLRGARMEDVIFAGTRDKKPLGMASVTMTLIPDRSQGGSEIAHVNGASANGRVNGGQEHGPIQTDVGKAAERTGEITITRRLYRSGESEYLINGKLARLRDIQDLFLGTGLGPESYAIIEQGRIGQILSNRPQDRRAVIEEAAGITKFKTRKRLAEAKLESAKQNLSRVFDILEEVTRQVNSLKRQAAKTRRYSELKAEVTGYLRQLLAAKFRMLERETAKITIELSLASTELREAQTGVTQREEEQRGFHEQSYANEQELTAARKQLADLELEAERARGRFEYQAKQIEQIQQRLASGEQEAAALQADAQSRAQELERQSAEHEALEAECARSRQELEARSAERQEAQSRLTAQERELEAARARLLKLLGDTSALENRITHVQAQLASMDRETERARLEEQQSGADLTRIKRSQGELSVRLAARQQELVSVTDQRQAAQQELESKRAQLHEVRQALDHARADFSHVKARKQSLEEVLQHRSYTTENVKRLFKAVETGKAESLHPEGVLADFLEVDPQVEKAAEEFLHDELEYVVVRDWAHAERGIELMRAELSGRATFLVEAAGEDSVTSSELPEFATEPRITGKLTDSLRFTNGLATIPLQMLPRIANCYLVEDRAAARDLAERFPHCWFLTPDGVNYHARTTSGGKKSGAGPLALKRELREISRLEETKQRELEAAERRVGDIEQTIVKLSAHLEHLRGLQQAQEKDVLALDHESRKLAEESQRAQSRLSHARLELERLSRERVKFDANLARDRQMLGEVQETKVRDERVLESAREELGRLQAEVAGRTEEHASLRAELASLEERRRSVAAQKARLEAEVRELAAQCVQLARESEQLREQRVQLLASNAELQGQTVKLQVSIGETRSAITALESREAELRAGLAEIEEQLKKMRAETQAVQERRAELQITLARAESDLKHLEETSQKELDVALPQLAEAMETVPDEAMLAGIEAKHAEVRRKIEALGPVNPQALEEFEEAQQRQEFLSAQRQDLLDSIRDTEKAIHEIDNESRKRFTEAFHAINENFREMFKILFGGGVGEMRLTDEENVAESGIDIVASPPGKKLQSVLLLSGGEKSLTAMALLMAVFQYTPSPFCILDEVDAPLDEPNIQRLTRLLQEMSDQTQFIVITHAKRTMEAAQALYGVTMEEPGVSKLVSVKFNEAAAMRTPDRSREERLEAALA